MNIKQLFFELIRVAIGNQVCLSRTPKVKEWGELYAMAKKQSLVGICFAGVQKLQAQRQAPNSWGNEQGEMLYLQWLGMAAMIQQRNETLIAQCVELGESLKGEGYRYAVLKGQAVAALYKSVGLKGKENIESKDGKEGVESIESNLSGLRQSGDIDIWMDGSREEIMAYVNKVSPTDEVRWLHTQMKVFDNTDVEVHFLPSYLECPWLDKALQRFFDSEKEACFAAGRCTDRFNQVFILAHAFRHLFGEGVGLRQLMDYYFVLRNSKWRMSREDFCKTMKETGMLRFAKAVMWILVHVFANQNENASTGSVQVDNKDWLLCEPDEKDGRFLLNEVIQSGNFGHQDERVKHSTDENAFLRFWRLSLYNGRVIRFSPWIVICSPFWRIWHWWWRKSKGYK